MKPVRGPQTRSSFYDLCCAIFGVPCSMPLLTDARPTLMIQGDVDGAILAGVTAFFASVWRVRAMCAQGMRMSGVGEIADLVRTNLLCPWLTNCAATTTKRDRRTLRVRPPQPMRDTVIYRSDGACRGQGSAAGECCGSFGSAVWAATEEGNAWGLPVATIRENLGPHASNNVAEYSGLRASMHQALRKLDLRVVFDVDSNLVARQMAQEDAWACRSVNLLHLHVGCVTCGDALTSAGIVWRVRHIYREYNQTADGLANAALDDETRNRPSELW